MKEQIKIDSVSLSYNDIEILRGARLEIEKNKVIGLLGRNGTGKSCFLKIIIGEITPQFKHISYNNQPLVHLYKQKGLINYLPQHEFHPQSLRLNDLLKYYEIDKELFLEKYGFLADLQRVKFSKLSGGERRLIEVLVVLESESKFTILDEPFSHIMPKHISLIKTTIKQLKAKKGIIITDHQYENVIAIADELYLLKDGMLQKVADIADLKTKGYLL